MFGSVIGNAQNENGFWKKSNSGKRINTNEKFNFPQNNTFDLDFTSLKKVLNSSPKRDLASKHSNVIITLPNVEGRLDKFKVYENSNLAPELAAKFPEIKSYVAVGVDNPSVRAYLSSSPLGFKGMIVYPSKETVFIEPLSNDGLNYSVYKTSDRKQVFSKFNCNDGHEVTDFTNQIIENSAFLRGADDSKLRTFRLAVSCTGEYAAYFGGTKALALAGINNTLTRVNGIFERDFGVRLQLVANNDMVVFTDGLTDPYSTSAYLANELQTTLNNNIGDANFDLGHLFDPSNAGGNSGGIGCVGITNSKGKAYSSKSNPSGDLFDIQFVAHEMAHQLGAKHTFTYVTESSNTAQMEPGSGSTIMSYAGKTVKDIQATYDNYFHAISIQQVTDKIKTLTCGTLTSTGNAVPVVNAGLDYTIPKGTPFMLVGSATDADSADQLTYSWEQIDLGNATTTVPASTNVTGVLFRSFNPSTSATRYFPTLNTILSGSTSTPGYRIISETLPAVARTLNFRLTVRDNKVGGGANNSDDVIVTVDAMSGPFTVDTQNTTTSFAAGTSQTINWTVAGTNANGINCMNVDILLSTDGGLTFPITLVAGTPNDGSQAVVIPNVSGTTNRIMVKGTNHIFFDINNSDFTITGSGLADTSAPTTTIISASGTTTSSTNLSWNVSSDNIGVTGYKVYQNGVLKATTTATSLVVSGLSAATTYGFYVTAYDAAGNTSVASNTLNVTTLTPMVTYCNSNGGTSFEFIKRVQFGTIDNLSGNNGGYGNFTSISTDVTIGSLVSISISSGWVSASYAEAFNVWIDYNKNGSFETSELVYSKSKSKSATVSGSFTIANSALTGATRMRVSMKYNLNPSACEVFTRGEVEDYTINILNGGLVKMSNESSESENTEVIEIKDDTVLKTNKTEVEELSYKLYPNPVKDGVMYFSGLTYQSNYKIFNQFGQQLAQGKIENDMINVSSLASGIYFVQVATNSSVGVKRFIKE